MDEDRQRVPGGAGVGGVGGADAGTRAPDTDWALARLEDLVRLESPSMDRDASLAITENLAAGFEDLGGSVQRHAFEGGQHLVVDVPGRGQPLLLVGHSDTVWARGTIDHDVRWSNDGAVVRGPGAYDMKAGLVVMEAALRRVAPSQRRRVRVLITADEEIGSPDGSSLVDEAVEGVRGALGFESPHTDGAFKIGRRGSTRVRLEVTGVAAHAAVDTGRGVSAIEELIDQLHVIARKVEQVSAAGPQVLFNIGTIAGGTQANVIPDAAEALLGLRFLDSSSEAEVLGFIDSLTPLRPRATVTATRLSMRPAWSGGEGDRGLLREICGIASGLGIACFARPAPGAGDLNLIGVRGIPSLDGFGPMGGGAHAVDEHVDIDSLVERIDLVEAIVRAPARPEEPSESAGPSATVGMTDHDVR